MNVCSCYGSAWKENSEYLYFQTWVPIIFSILVIKSSDHLVIQSFLQCLKSKKTLIWQICRNHECLLWLCSWLFFSLIPGWSFRTNSTMEPVSNFCPSTSPSCPRFLSKMACFNPPKAAVDVRFSRLYNCEGFVSVGMIHSVTTANPQDSELKLILVATFITLMGF